MGHLRAGCDHLGSLRGRPVAGAERGSGLFLAARLRADRLGFCRCSRSLDRELPHAKREVRHACRLEPSPAKAESGEPHGGTSLAKPVRFAVTPEDETPIRAYLRQSRHSDSAGGSVARAEHLGQKFPLWCSGFAIQLGRWTPSFSLSRQTMVSLARRRSGDSSGLGRDHLLRALSVLEEEKRIAGLDGTSLAKPGRFALTASEEMDIHR